VQLNTVGVPGTSHRKALMEGLLAFSSEIIARSRNGRSETQKGSVRRASMKSMKIQDRAKKYKIEKKMMKMKKR
jgi:hypothetical protein